MAKSGPVPPAKPRQELVEVVGLRRVGAGYRVVRGAVGLDMLELDEVPEQPLEYATQRLVTEAKRLIHRAGTRR